MPHGSGGAEANFTHRPRSSDSGALGALQAHAQSTLSSLRTESGKFTFFHSVNNFSLLLGCICSELFLPVVIDYDISKETDILSKLFGHLCTVSVLLRFLIFFFVFLLNFQACRWSLWH